MNDEEKDALGVLYHLRRNGETLTRALERIVRRGDTAEYDRRSVDNAKKEAREAQIMFGAAVLSQPNRELRITRAAQAAISGPERLELTTYEDLATGETIFKVKER